MLLQPEALLFQHKRLSFLIRPALKLSGLQKASVITNVMVSGTVQTEVVRKFNGKSALGQTILLFQMMHTVIKVTKF